MKTAQFSDTFSERDTVAEDSGVIASDHVVCERVRVCVCVVRMDHEKFCCRVWLEGSDRSDIAHTHTHTATAAEINSVMTLHVFYNRREKRDALAQRGNTLLSFCTKHSTISLLRKCYTVSTYLTNLSTQGQMGFLQASMLLNHMCYYLGLNSTWKHIYHWNTKSLLLARVFKSCQVIRWCTREIFLAHRKLRLTRANTELDKCSQHYVKMRVSS